MTDARRNVSPPPATAPISAGRSPAPASRARHAAPQAAGGVREVVETVVFVVVVVMLLKTFVAEAFVIPTGSMATSLWGDQKIVTCPQCNFEFPVNCSSEHDEDLKGDKRDRTVVGCICPNCRYHIEFQKDRLNPTCRTGDRVMVAKFLYDLSLDDLDRNDVVVFKYPEAPQKNFSPVNYIKRLVGKPNETIGIYNGDLYLYPAPASNDSPLTYPGRPRPEKATDLWKRDYMYENDAQALALFEQGRFAIVRKSPSKILSMARPVYDNDHPAKDLLEKHYPPRWAPEKEESNVGPRAANFEDSRARGRDENAWLADGANGFRHPGRSGALAWLRYRHLIVDRSTEMSPKPPSEIRPELITDFLGYDTWQTQSERHAPPPSNWVGDLLLECDVAIEHGETAERELVLELSRGVDRFQARWDLATGDCSIVRLTGDQGETLASQSTSLKTPGTYHLRFANVDERLTVWVDGKLPFGDGVAYPTPRRRGPTRNDLEPASIAARGAGVSVHKLQLWRDTYYTLEAGLHPDATERVTDWSDPQQWGPLRELPKKTLHVQPDHFLCLGDNSPESSDGRYWGFVPRRLMLGRALLVYWPIPRAGPIK